MMGAANRADIRRLRELEDQNAALAAKLEMQQRHLRDGFVARDEKIRALNEALCRALAQAPVSAAHVADDAVAARDALIDLERRLSRDVARRERLEARLETMTLACRETESRQQAAEHENSKLRNEIALVEAHFNTSMAHDAKPQEIDPERIAATMPELDGTLVLYVGGRAHQVPALKAVVERAGGIFLYHDGGIEHAAALLPGLVSRADCAAFPIDCVSHDAMTTVKRLCRQAGKPLIPLRTIKSRQPAVGPRNAQRGIARRRGGSLKAAGDVNRGKNVAARPRQSTAIITSEALMTAWAFWPFASFNSSTASLVIDAVMTCPPMSMRTWAVV